MPDRRLYKPLPERADRDVHDPRQQPAMISVVELSSMHFASLHKNNPSNGITTAGVGVFAQVLLLDLTSVSRLVEHWGWLDPV